MRGTLTLAGYLRVWAVWLGIAGVVFVACMMLGQGNFGTRGIALGWPEANIREFRLQRVLAGAMVGLALSAAGVTLQALLRNPLAEPYVLGISSGSAVGVLAWLIATGPLYAHFASSPAALALLSAGRCVPAVAGALITCVAVFAIARKSGGGAGRGGIEPVTLLLVGVVVSAMNAAILMIVNEMAEQGFKVNLANYMLGSISDGDLNWKLMGVAAAVLLVAYIPVLLSGAALNVGSLSDVEATSLGVNVRRLRVMCFVSASVMTGAALMLSGPIGFVGLICPHICRSLGRLGGPVGGLGGADHRKLVVAAPLCGAAFLMAADTAVRVAQNTLGTEFPVGVVTALCGGPFFLFLLRRRGV